ncbi:hypothetical protein OAI28_01480 [Methylophilaceae bacterium]|jgi:hypothetical protein|nr:hypothetical protein [Methylophilaceae bacterium]|tara:strand:- start:145 stop:318 length:174 start_codon:yes stop_codon:yes gene_type:complete
MTTMISAIEIKYLIASLAKDRYFLFFVKRKNPIITAKKIQRRNIINLANIIILFLNA